MKETTPQYIKRMRGYITDKKPMDVLAATPPQLHNIIQGIPKRKLTRRPAPDAWSVAEICAHFADVEIVQSYRIRLVLETNKTPIQGYSQDAWAQLSNYAAHDPALSLESFRANRERNVRLLKSLPRSKWNRYGMHSERGKETLTRMIEMMAGHGINHLNQIRKILK